jgi:hypothetical protein
MQRRSHRCLTKSKEASPPESPPQSRFTDEVDAMGGHSCGGRRTISNGPRLANVAGLGLCCRHRWLCHPARGEVGPPEPTSQRAAPAKRSPLREPPGVFFADVTQANVSSTICVSGWTATVRPSTSFTGRLKLLMLSRAGLQPADAARFELDHYFPLALGGHPRSEDNLWLQPWEGTWTARLKDRLERSHRRGVMRIILLLGCCALVACTTSPVSGRTLSRRLVLSIPACRRRATQHRQA